MGNESYHPNQNAQPLYRNRILFSTQNFTVENPAPNQNEEIPQPDGNFWPAEASQYIDFLNDPTTHSSPVPPKKYESFVSDTDEIRELEVNKDFLKPGSEVSITLYSNPTDLGTYTVNAEGLLDTQITIPDEIDPGVHTISIIGKNLADKTVMYEQKVLVGGLNENDLDGDGVLDDEDPCLFIEASGIDVDQDGVDDACDGFIDEAPESNQPLSNSSSEDKVINETEARPNDSYILGEMQQTSNSSTGQDLQPMQGYSTGDALQGSSLQGSSTRGTFQGSSFTQVAGESTTNPQSTGQFTEQQLAENIDSTIKPKETSGGSALLFAVFGGFLVIGLIAVGLNQFRKSQ